MVGDVLGGAMLIFLALALYRLFKGVDQNHALLVLILGGVMPAAIYFFNVANDVAALTLVRGADSLSVFDEPQRDALAMLFLGLHDGEVVAAETLWGLWLFRWRSSCTGRASCRASWASGWRSAVSPTWP